MKTIFGKQSGIRKCFAGFFRLLLFLSATNSLIPVCGAQEGNNNSDLRVHPLVIRRSVCASPNAERPLKGIAYAAPQNKIAADDSVLKCRVKLNPLVLVASSNLKHQIESHSKVKGRGPRLEYNTNTFPGSNPFDKDGPYLSNWTSMTRIEGKKATLAKGIKGAGGTLGDFFEVASSTPSRGTSRIEVTPRISLEEKYDDNVFLRKTNIVSDYITTLSPGINLVASSNTNGIDLDYEFGWVKYYNRSRNDYVRHQGALKAWQQLGRHVTLRFEDYYIKSDDILAAIDQIPVTQRIPDPETLQSYQRNNARAFFEYQFGPLSQLTAGYLYNFTDNDDPDLEDTIEYGPFASLSHWFNQKSGVELDYSFSRYDYRKKNTSLETRPDLDRQDILGRYIHRFGARTSALAQYGVFIRNFPDVSVNYQIHDFSAGFDHAFSPQTAVSLGAGYYRATGDTNIEPGYNLLAAISRSFERGNLSFRLVHSFDQGYNEVVPRGFTVYSEALLKGDYAIKESLRLYGLLSYRRNDYSNDELDILGGEAVPDDQTYRARFGIDWDLHRWVSLNLGYEYTKRISDDPEFGFDDNRVTLKLTGFYPYRW